MRGCMQQAFDVCVCVCIHRKSGVSSIIVRRISDRLQNQLDTFNSLTAKEKDQIMASTNHFGECGVGSGGEGWDGVSQSLPALSLRSHAVL